MHWITTSVCVCLGDGDYGSFCKELHLNLFRKVRQPFQQNVYTALIHHFEQVRELWEQYSYEFSVVFSLLFF